MPATVMAAMKVLTRAPILRKGNDEKETARSTRSARLSIGIEPAAYGELCRRQHRLRKRSSQ
jgi:hypothetical protein